MSIVYQACLYLSYNAMQGLLEVANFEGKFFSLSTYCQSKTNDFFVVS